MSYFKQTGSFNSLLKEGFRHYQGKQQAVMKNIEAIADLAEMTRTAYGPRGMNKYIINQHDKLFLTKNTGVMTEELDINHPAVNIICDAIKSQLQEEGDGTNFVSTFSGELLNLAGQLIEGGVSLPDITAGYEKAFSKTMELIETLPQYKIENIRDVGEATKIIKPVIGSKMVHGQENILAPLIAEACIHVLPEKIEKFDVDNVRTAKILGGSLMDSTVLRGLLVTRNVEGAITKATKCKVAVYNCPFETQGAETNDQIVFKNAEELLNYTKGEEDHMEKLVKEIVDSGVKVMVCGGNVSNMAIHYLDKYGILVFRVMSKFEIRRIAKSLGATLLVRLGAPTKEEMGECDEITVTEISSTKCILIKRESDSNKLATVVLRGTTNDMLDNMIKVVENGVNVYRAACKDNKFIGGAGASEIALSLKIKEFAKDIKTLDQYSVDKFGDAFEVVPRTIAENCGYNIHEVLANLRSKASQKENMGLDIESGEIKDAFELKIFDHLETKKWAIKLAVNAVLTVLKIDQIIVAKPAGGPNLTKRPKELGKDETDEF